MMVNEPLLRRSGQVYRDALNAASGCLFDVRIDPVRLLRIKPPAGQVVNMGFRKVTPKTQLDPTLAGSRQQIQ